jgi:hypothetical protein
LHQILIKVRRYLSDVAEGNTKPIDGELLEDFEAKCYLAAHKHLVEPREDKFRLRMSNVGKPSCQLQLEKAGIKGETSLPWNVMRNTYGDLTEALAVLIMKQAGVNITSEQGEVELLVEGKPIRGTYDLVIDEGGPKVWDVKSASGWSFKNKFKDFDTVFKDDHFGYVCQGFGYAEALQIPFGGWIVVNKEDGEWAVVEVPNSDAVRREALERIRKNVSLVSGEAEFQKSFSDVEETWRRRPTGNRVLTAPCIFCPYKNTCWDNLEYRAQLPSESQSPKHYFYTHIDEKWRNGKTKETNSGRMASSESRDTSNSSEEVQSTA